MVLVYAYGLLTTKYIYSIYLMNVDIPVIQKLRNDGAYGIIYTQEAECRMQKVAPLTWIIKQNTLETHFSKE